MNDLLQKKCIPCEVGAPGLTPDEAAKYLSQVPGWKVSEDFKSISRDFTFIDFKRALSFVNEVGDLAEFEGHHPDISIWYDKVKLSLSTHAIKGLTENDFILAAKIDKIDQPQDKTQE